MKAPISLIVPVLKMLNALQPMSKALQKTLTDSFFEEIIPKGKLILKEGEVCDHLWYLSKGLLRSYHYLNEKEITSRIMFTGHIVISAGSFFSQTPATESIQAMTGCTLAKISYPDLQKIYNTFPEFNYHTRLITEQYFYKQELRLYMLRQQNIKERYAYFEKNYSAFFKDVPVKYAASFLNISRETFSRLRNKRN